MKNNRTDVAYYTLTEWLFSANWVGQDSIKIKEKTNLYKNKEENEMGANCETAERLLFLL